MSVTLIISSPHGLCPPNKIDRVCDLSATISAIIFCKAIMKYGNIRYDFLPGDEYRYVHDLNRISSRNTSYRKRLEEKFKQSSKSSIIIDVHSFPNTYLDEAGEINFFKKGEIAPDVVLLGGPKDSFGGNSLCLTLFDALSKDKVNCKIINGISVNDILNQGYEYGVSGVLIEFNEKYSKQIDRLYEICDIIAKALSKIGNI